MAKAAHYIKGKWAGMDNYECKYCSYATLELKEMEQHLNKKHQKFLNKPVQKMAPKPEMEIEKETKGIENG